MNTSIKLLSVALLLGAAAFVGCKKDDDKNQSPATKIAGTYLVYDTTFVDQSNPTCAGMGNQTETFGITITENGENKVNVEGYKYPGTTVASVTNTALVITGELGQAYNIVATISGDKIYFSYSNGGYCHPTGRSTAVKQE